MKRRVNTPEKGTFRHIVFREGGVWYAAALELNITESGDDPKLAYFNLLQAVSGYLESCRKLRGARFAPLNQKADPEYEKLWADVQSERRTPALEVAKWGTERLAFA